MTLDHKNNSFKVSFIVVDSDSVPILGLKTSEHLQLIKRICSIETNGETIFSEFHDCFGEIGTLVKDNVKPVVTPVRKVPHALKPKLQKELKRMVDLDITELIEKPTGGVNGLVIVEKPNGKLRICLNPQRYKARTPSPSHCRGNISTNVWCLLFLKTRCFLGILANKSR